PQADPQKRVKPVMLPPGRAKFSTSPMPMGLPTIMKTIGSVDAWRFAANDALVPDETKRSTPRSNKALTALSGIHIVQTTSSKIYCITIRPVFCTHQQKA